MPLPSGNDFCIDLINFVADISWYFAEFILPSIGHNLPVPLNLKHPQNIFFGGCFGACCLRKLLRASPTLHLSYCGLWPCTSKWFSSESITFLHSFFSHFWYFLAHTKRFNFVAAVSSCFFRELLAFLPA